MAASVVSVINYKGGVGKTTVCGNVGAELAARGRRVLLVDLDPQASLTFSFIRPDEWEADLAPRATLLQWFTARQAGGAEPLEKYLIVPSATNQALGRPGGLLHLLPSHLGLLEVDLDLAASLGGARFQEASPRFLPVYRLLADGLREQILDRYDVVLIDCAPNFNPITRTAIVASDHVLVPARPDYLSTLGVDYLRARLSTLVDQYNARAPDPIGPELLGVVYTMVQHTGAGVLRSQRQSMERLETIEIPIFTQTIRDNKNAFTDSGTQMVPAVLATERSEAMENLRYELQQLTSEFIARTRV